MNNTKLNRAVSVAMATLACAALLASPAIIRAQTPAPLLNEGFESGFQNDPYCKAGDCLVPQGWGVWFIPRTENDPTGVNFQPKYEQTTQPNRVHTGSGAQRIWTDNATHTGGIYRVLKDVQVGSRIRFTAWGQVWSTNDESPISARPSRDIRLKIGVDPLGGNDGNPSPLNGQVQWSPEQEAKDAYVQFSVEVEVRSPTVILYTYSTMRDNVRHNNVFWDDAVVEYIAPPPTATPESVITTTTTTTDTAVTAPITPTAEAAAPAQTGAVTYTVKAGDTLFGIALDQGVTLEELLANNPGVQAELLQLGQELIIKPGTTVEATAAPDPAAAAAAAQAPADPNAVIATPADVITATATAGEACVQSFFDDNGNGKRDDTEDLVPNILFAITANNQQLASYTTTGVDEPYCFPNLNNGSYTIAATALDIYAPTTPLNDSMNVNGGKSFFSVGLRRVTDGAVDVTRPAEPVTTNTAGPNWMGIAAIAGGALLLVGTVGFGASLFLRRRRL
jgi:LysM repeat protein